MNTLNSHKPPVDRKHHTREVLLEVENLCILFWNLSRKVCIGCLASWLQLYMIFQYIFPYEYYLYTVVCLCKCDVHLGLMALFKVECIHVLAYLVLHRRLSSIKVFVCVVYMASFNDLIGFHYLSHGANHLIYTLGLFVQRNWNVYIEGCTYWGIPNFIGGASYKDTKHVLICICSVLLWKDLKMVKKSKFYKKLSYLDLFSPIIINLASIFMHVCVFLQHDSFTHIVLLRRW